jgi:hypothetical protein
VLTPLGIEPQATREAGEGLALDGVEHPVGQRDPERGRVDHLLGARFERGALERDRRQWATREQSGAGGLDAEHGGHAPRGGDLVGHEASVDPRHVRRHTHDGQGPLGLGEDFGDLGHASNLVSSPVRWHPPCSMASHESFDGRLRLLIETVDVSHRTHRLSPTSRGPIPAT